MAMTQGLIDSYWRKYNQRRALTGLPSSYQEQRGMLDPMMESAANKDIQEAQLRYQNERSNRQLSMQEQAQKDAAKAASISGATNLASIGASSYLGYQSLQKPTIADYLMTQRSAETVKASNDLWATGWPGTSAPSASLGSAVPSSAAPAYSGASSAAPSSLTAGASGTEYGSLAGAGSGGEGILAGTAPTATSATPTAIVGAGSGGEGILAGAGSGAAAASEGSAAYTGATGTAAYGAAEGSGAAGVLGAEGATAGLSAYAAPVGAGLIGGGIGHRLADKFSPIGGEKEKRIGGGIVGGAAAGAAVGSIIPVIGTAVGAIIGGIVGGISEAVDSVICSELLRQGRISERDRTKCVVYRFRHISDEMFMAYLEWAEPIVKAMRREGVSNSLLLPFAHKFIDYMISVQDGRMPTFTERTVWKYAWWRCERIARKQGAMISQEVA